jgi:hypothetical protein
MFAGKCLTTFVLGLVMQGCPCLKGPKVNELRCTQEERALWKDNPEFTKRFQTCAGANFANAKGVGVCMHTAYPALSTECGTCLGEGSNCAANNCMTECIINQGSPACQACFAAKCNGALLTCTGALSEDDLPVPPVDTSLTTTGAPRAPRTRKPTTTISP